MPETIWQIDVEGYGVWFTATRPTVVSCRVTIKNAFQSSQAKIKGETIRHRTAPVSELSWVGCRVSIQAIDAPEWISVGPEAIAKRREALALLQRGPVLQGHLDPVPE